MDSTLGIVAHHSRLTKKGKIPMLATPIEVSCAVEVFIATALLHREQPNRPEFTIQEIVRRAAQENITGEMRSGVNVHASQHCVANKAPNPNRHKMIYASGKKTRRLLLPTDKVHAERTGKIFPDPGEIPERYLPLLEWAKQRYYGSLSGSPGSAAPPTPVLPQSAVPRRHLQAFLDAKGIGIEMARGIDPDEYIRELREGWE
jgi:hypothetical protein